jgi:ribosome-associated translation inhibitor RaiA
LLPNWEEVVMKPAAPNGRLPVKWDTKHCTLSPAVLRKFEEGLEPVARVVRDFPVCALNIVVERFPRTTRYRVKTSLVLTGETLVSLDEGDDLHPAFERCVQNLVQDVHAYKDRMGKVAEVAKHAKGTHQEVEPTVDPDPAALDRAVAEGDYAAFRRAAFGYDEPLRRRIGRWVERHPAVSARIGKGLTIDDLVEEVFLDAFESYEQRPKGIRLGDWIEGLIDPAIKEVAANPEGVLENVNLARAARAAGERPV